MTPFLLHYRANQENKQGKQPGQTHLIVFPDAGRYNILLSYFLDASTSVLLLDLLEMDPTNDLLFAYLVMICLD